MKLLIIDGPNMNLLGLREPALYGTQSYDALVRFTRDACVEAGFEAEFFQSNHEGDIVDRIQAAYGCIDGIVINPAAYTHTSVAIADALAAVGIPAVEVHLTDINAREEFRRRSYVAPVCRATFAGHGFEGYRMAVLYLKKLLEG